MKLLSKANKVAYHLLNKLVFNAAQAQLFRSSSGGDEQLSALKQGDRVALVFANNDPVQFTVAFCACLIAGLIAIPIDVPNTCLTTTSSTSPRRDVATSHTLGLGFLLGQVGASLVLTSDACYKSCAKASAAAASGSNSGSGENTIDIKGWPRIPWLVIEDLNKPVAKDWSPPYNLSKKTTAYIEVKQTTNKTKYQEDSLFLFVCSTSTF